MTKNKETKAKNKEKKNQIHTCKNCGNTYRERDNTLNSCQYHPGPLESASRADTIEDYSRFVCCNARFSNLPPVQMPPGCTIGKHISEEK